MNYRTRVRRKRGQWHIDVPALPRDAPVVVTRQLGNAAPLLISELAEYLGVSVDVIEVSIEHPHREKRRKLRDRLTADGMQLSGGVAALSGVYLAAGTAATLITAGSVITALAALRESGRI